MNSKWRGVVISEGLLEPSLVNDFEVYKARVSKEDLDLGEGKRGRWHLYHVYATESQIERLATQVRPGWYCHFWQGKNLMVVFPGKRFDLKTDDRSTWKEAVEYGKSFGIPENELDFPTD